MHFRNHPRQLHQRDVRPRKHRCFRPLLLCIVFLSAAILAAQQSDANQTTPAPESPKSETKAEKNFFARWAHFYRDDWFASAASTPASSPSPARRGLPSPLESPPFPNSDWSYGGSPVIGEPDSNSYPLMTAINQARSRTKLYGWIDPTLNF